MKITEAHESTLQAVFETYLRTTDRLFGYNGHASTVNIPESTWPRKRRRPEGPSTKGAPWGW